jgi:NADH-quinone oxidoreductase subunit A
MAAEYAVAAATLLIALALETWVQFRVRYAVLALLFVAFDMEMVYMFPWAVVFKRLGVVAFLDMFVFIAILAAAIAYAWKEGVFDWEG